MNEELSQQLSISHCYDNIDDELKQHFCTDWEERNP